MDRHRFGSTDKVFLPKEEERDVVVPIAPVSDVTIFIKNRDRAVDQLDIMIRADIAIAVRWQTERAHLSLKLIPYKS